MADSWKIDLQDNSKVVVKTMQGNVPAALAAMGTKAVNLIIHEMQYGFARRIWRTGDLQRDVQYETHPESKSVNVGNTLHYGVYVHEGTYKMAGRPYIYNALTGEDHARQLREVAENELKKGF